MKDHLPILVGMVPLVGAFLAVLLGIFTHRLSRWTVLGSLLAALFLLGKTLPKILNEGSWHYSLGGWAPPWGIEWVITPFSALLAGFVLLLALGALWDMESNGTTAGLVPFRESLGTALLLVLVSSLLAGIFVRDGFTLYLSIQIAVIAAAGLLVCLVRQGTLEAFYFTLGGSTGASLLLAGFLTLYAGTGTLHLNDLLDQLFISKNFPLVLAAGLLLAAGWSFFLVFPSPIFFPRLINQTPPFFLGFLSSALVRPAAYLLFMLLFFTLDVPGMDLPGGVNLLSRLITVAFLVHFIGAAREKDFLKSTAYLSVAQLGFLFIGFIVGSKSALTGALMELLSQMLVVMGLFTAVGALSLKPAGGRPFSKLAGLGRHDFPTALALIVFVFSIVGIPPTGGFFGKFYLVQGLMEKRDWFLLISLAAVLAFNLVPAARFTWLLFEHRKTTSIHAPIPLVPKSILLSLALAVLLLGLFHQEIIHNLIEPALPKAFLNTPVPNVPFLGKQVE